MNENLNRLVSRIHQHPQRDCGTGATVDEIAVAENALGVRFPDEYRDFLLRVGWGGIAHVQVIGLGSGVPRALDLVNTALRERNKAEPPMRPEIIPVVADGSGNHYCVLATQDALPGCPVYFWDIDSPDEESQTMTVVNNDFYAWLSARFDSYGL